MSCGGVKKYEWNYYQSLQKFDEPEQCLFSFNEIVTKIGDLTWLRVSEERDQFYVTKLNEKKKYTSRHWKTGVRNLGEGAIRQIAAHPYFWNDKF